MAEFSFEFRLAGRLTSAYILAPSPCGGMADAIDSKSIAARHGGSTPSTGTTLSTVGLRDEVDDVRQQMFLAQLFQG